MGRLNPPEPLTADHPVHAFDCGNPTLNEWLQRQALANQTHGASRTFVVCDEHGAVAGYYALATGSVERQQAPGNVRRNMPEPIPVMALGRLAVDLNFQQQGIGKGLLKDAVMRTLQVSTQAGIRALLVHAISEPAHDFYVSCGFRESPVNHMTLMITLAEASRTLHP